MGWLKPRPPKVKDEQFYNLWDDSDPVMYLFLCIKYVIKARKYLSLLDKYDIFFYIKKKKVAS